MKKYDYPEDPHQHIVTTKLKEKRTVIDENYKYVSHNFFYKIWCGIVRVFGFIFFPIAGKIWLSYKIKGKKNLRKVKGGAVLVANHVHYIDILLLKSAVCRWRKTYFITLASDMDIPIAAPLIRGYGALPLATTFGGVKKLNATVDELLQKKKRLIVFPEAALWPYYNDVRPFQKGAFVFATRNNVPIIPVVLSWTKTKFFKRPKLIMTILPPVSTKGANAQEVCDLTYEVCSKAHDEATAA